VVAFIVSRLEEALLWGAEEVGGLVRPANLLIYVMGDMVTEILLREGGKKMVM
jgi:hypothetical protein